MAEDKTKITNIQERRKMMMKSLVEALNIPYNQYDTAYNRKLAEALIVPILNRSLIGYDFQNVWEAQIGEEQDKAIERLFKIKRKFLDYELTDEQFNSLANFAQAIRMVNTNDLASISKAIEDYITEDFCIISTPREMLYILQLEEPLLEAIIYYSLLPTNVSSKTKILVIPPEYKGCKIWSWAIVPNGAIKYWQPNMTAYWLYNKVLTPTVISNPLFILPEWYRTIADNSR